MTIPVDPAFAFLALVVCADAAAVAAFFAGRARRRSTERARLRARRLASAILAGAAVSSGRSRRDEAFVRRKKWIFLEETANIADAVVLSDGQRRSLAGLLVRCRVPGRLVRGLRSANRHIRARAAAALAFFRTRPVLALLVKALEVERSYPVKILLAAALAESGDPAVVPTIIDTLKGSPERYQRAVRGIVAEYGDGLDEILPVLTSRPEKEIQMLLIHQAGRNCCPLIEQYVERLSRSADLDVARAAFRVLATVRAGALDHPRYLSHDDFLVRNLAAESLGRLPRTESLALLFEHMDDPVIRKSAALAVTALIRARPHFLKIVMHRCLNERRPNARRVLADVLANFTDYIMGKLHGDDEELAGKVLRALVRHGKTNEIINFLNRNTDVEIETKALALLRAILEKSGSLAGDFLCYLDGRIAGELGIDAAPPSGERPARRERPNRPLLAFFLFVGALLAPAVCLVAAFFDSRTGPAGALPLFLRSFNTVFAAYSIALSALYLLVMLFSLRGASRQARNLALPRASLLFTEGVLPSMSIISPAYNEEATIVESVTALFNLRYPDYEIIVVNDGSTDRTLERLIEAFALERTDVFIHGYLRTAEIRGVYAGKRYPELLVLDKANGGKADSLNAGINLSRKEYFSGIDADSLLDQDALLNLASLFLFSEEPVLAAGGNILPANGCVVSGGAIESTRIPAGHLARFQTVEYVRAFMAGRVGWSELKLLLIISGAFGVFHCRSVINAGGYLTRSERYRKDTVGEDMELVVRLCRQAIESRTRFAMVYGRNADCWTEIPERLPSLVNQRDRWQRGLLDIISFHWRLLFNPAYGRMGLIGMPYFLVFEAMGPWLEIEGFLVFVVSLAAGWIAPPLTALVFAATVGMGFLVSVLSISILERGKEHFPLRDKLKLLLYSFLENFGVRQFLNFLRVRGFVRLLAKAEGWGKMERRGWRARENPPKEAHV